MYESLSEIKVQLTVFLESLSEIKKAEEGLSRIVLKNEEAYKRRIEDILRSLNEIKEKVDGLRERPEKRWFRLR